LRHLKCQEGERSVGGGKKRNTNQLKSLFAAQIRIRRGFCRGKSDGRQGGEQGQEDDYPIWGGAFIRGAQKSWQKTLSQGGCPNKHVRWLKGERQEGTIPVRKTKCLSIKLEKVFSKESGRFGETENVGMAEVKSQIKEKNRIIKVDKQPALNTQGFEKKKVKPVHSPPGYAVEKGFVGGR